jgi:hypothetical protein
MVNLGMTVLAQQDTLICFRLQPVKTPAFPRYREVLLAGITMVKSVCGWNRLAIPTPLAPTTFVLNELEFGPVSPVHHLSGFSVHRSRPRKKRIAAIVATFTTLSRFLLF